MRTEGLPRITCLHVCQLGRLLPSRPSGVLSLQSLRWTGRLYHPTDQPSPQIQMPLHLQTTVRQRGRPSCLTHQPPRGKKEPSSSRAGVGDLGFPAASDPSPSPFSRKRSPPMGGTPSPSSLSLPPSTGFPLQTSGAPSPYLSSVSWDQDLEVVCSHAGNTVGHWGTGARSQSEASQLRTCPHVAASDLWRV